jgi:hypothetical protein
MLFRAHEFARFAKFLEFVSHPRPKRKYVHMTKYTYAYITWPMRASFDRPTEIASDASAQPQSGTMIIEKPCASHDANLAAEALPRSPICVILFTRNRSIAMRLRLVVGTPREMRCDETHGPAPNPESGEGEMDGTV